MSVYIVMKKEVMPDKHHFFCKRKYEIEGLADIFGIVAKAFAVFIPLPAVAFATGAILAEGGTSPEIIEEKIDGIKNGVTDKMKKENTTEKKQRQQGQDQQDDK